MKIQTKLALYNTITKIAIIVAIGALLPLIIKEVVYTHIDNRLKARTDRIFMMIERGGISEITLEQDCSFESFNILKEEFINIQPLTANYDQLNPDPVIGNENIVLDDEYLLHRVIKQPFIYDNQLYQLKIGEGLSTIDDLNRTVREFTLWLTVILIVISVITDIAFSKIIFKPFHKIIDLKIKPHLHPAHYQPKEIKTNTDEFELLNRSIDEMMQKVKDTFQIEKEFIANVSHELLTPISILQTRIENLLANQNIPHEASEKLVESLNTISRLTRTIKALLLISKIENEQYLKNEKVDIKELVKEVIAEIEERLTENNITIEENWQDNFTAGPANKSLLFTMIFNLISNAIKYNKVNGKIIIEGKNSGNRFVLAIKDTGVGMDSLQVQHAFDRFRRFEKNGSEGYGLGLPIVKKIAEFHKIKIEIDSIPGEGSAFKLIF